VGEGEADRADALGVSLLLAAGTFWMVWVGRLGSRYGLEMKG